MQSEDALEIVPVGGAVHGSIRPPGSKSLTNRAVVCAALASGESLLRGVLDSEDTRYMAAAIASLGVAVDAAWGRGEMQIRGRNGGFDAADEAIFVGNSGTTARFVTPLLALGQGSYRLDGVARMRERPIQDLVDALTQLGVAIRSEEGTGCPPIVVRGGGLRGGEVQIPGDTSSQFLSGLLMAAPYADAPVNVVLARPLVSQPYVRMTIAVMQSFGVDVEADMAHGHFRIAAPQRYRGVEYEVEPDASAASYFLAAAAITGGRVCVEGLSRDALQGDVEVAEVFRKMGCSIEYGADRICLTGGKLCGVEVDMNGISDTVQTVAAVAVFADGPTKIRGVGHIRHKETDRIGALATELRKLGANVVETSDGLEINPPEMVRGATIETYDDHRMAMSLSLVGLRVKGIRIIDPGCTAKTYPAFFDDLEALVRS